MDYSKTISDFDSKHRVATVNQGVDTFVKFGAFLQISATFSGHSGLVGIDVVEVVVTSMLLLVFSVVIDSAVVVFLLLCISFNSELDAVIQL